MVGVDMISALLDSKNKYVFKKSWYMNYSGVELEVLWCRFDICAFGFK